MTDLELIKNLEQHAGFTLYRLTCDGNVYAGAVDLNTAFRAKSLLARAFTVLRDSMLKLDHKDVDLDVVGKSMDSFNIEDWSD